ncbi:hypothetical protein BDK51DRAFT_46125 [Blyttiomyces helicus]|uniref:F-box domain-containing protein n=1 Tax=Blyttiomyces helicus TaxID=388810 RepID=A0A4P9WK66_9FUNG|nr:hypothetical protein BDK51DRAFT_46125 [Blyttiomyces helicus]|eukprot:RKO91540.1 hypothetical protein BDK51DRAFT_46125 [Blyttiomyces helicus]
MSVQPTASPPLHNPPPLPFEVWMEIFGHLDFPSLVRAAKVGRTWSVWAGEESLWKNLCRQHGAEGVETIAAAGEHADGESTPRPPTYKALFAAHHIRECERRRSKPLWASYDDPASLRSLMMLNGQAPPRFGASIICLPPVPCAQCEQERGVGGAVSAAAGSSAHGGWFWGEQRGAGTSAHTSPVALSAADSMLPTSSLSPATLDSFSGIPLLRQSPGTASFNFLRASTHAAVHHPRRSVGGFSRASVILHTLTSGCELGVGLKDFVPRVQIIRAPSGILGDRERGDGVAGLEGLAGLLEGVRF